MYVSITTWWRWQTPACCLLTLIECGNRGVSNNWVNKVCQFPLTPVWIIPSAAQPNAIGGCLDYSAVIDGDRERLVSTCVWPTERQQQQQQQACILKCFLLFVCFLLLVVLLRFSSLMMLPFDWKKKKKKGRRRICVQAYLQLHQCVRSSKNCDKLWSTGHIWPTVSL